MTLEATNADVVTRFLAAFSSGDVQKTMDLMADTGTWWVAGTMPISGTYDKAAFTKLLEGVVDTLEGPIKIVPTAFTAQGERVAVEAESFARTRSGRTYNNLYHFLFIVRGGKVAAVKEYLDTVHTQAVLCTA